MKPKEIEEMSFKIIEKEAGSHSFTSDQWQIVRRMIHTSADFEYKESVRFHPLAVGTGIAAIRGGKRIITDTNMARAGIRKKELQRFGIEVSCHVDDPRVVKIASDKGETRSRVAVDAVIDEIEGGIYVVGNAPTALLRVVELIREQRISPALIIGLPVGFVNAAESKEALMELDTPYISNSGRKGGSNVAASVVNALAIMATEN